MALLVFAALALVGFVVVETRSDSPMLQLHFFKNPTFTAANTVAFLVSFGMFGMFFFLSLYLQNVHGYSAVQAGLRFLPQTLAIIVTAPLAGRLAGRLGSRLPMTVGMLLTGSALLLLTRADVHTGYSLLWWNFTMAGIGMGLTMTPMTAAVMGTVPPARAGMASATTNTSREVGGVFGIALLGAIVTARMKSSLVGKLAVSGLPADIQARITASVGHGAGGGADIAKLPAAARDVVVPAINSSFVSGMHVALVVAGVSLLVGSAMAAAFVQRPARRPADAAAGDLQPDPAPAIAH
jgi:predicted MFS family arabinose efflux permease